MKVVTAEQMRIIDKMTIGEYGIPGHVLMERAGLAVAAKVRELFGKRKVVILCGGGNNGGDGLVAARDLFNSGWNVKALLFTQAEKMSPDCLAQFRAAGKAGVGVEFRTALRGSDLHSAVVVDAIFGTGLSKPVASFLAGVVRFLNESEVPVVSVDIPSGISSDSGRVMGEAVRADYTVTFGLPKAGHFLHPGAEYTGRLSIADIGFPVELLSSQTLKVQTIERGEAADLIPERSVCSHKGDYGHVLIVAGSRGKTGAALMSARACLRAGAGMVTIGVAETLADVFQSHVTEEMVLPLPDNGEGIISERACSEILDFLDRKADVLAIGPGLTAGRDIVSLVTKLLPSATVPMVIDADALNALSGRTGLLRKLKSPAILTPHPGEMARLMKSGVRSEEPEAKNWDPEETGRDRIGTALSFSKKTGVCLILKGVPTVIAEPEGNAFINTTGNPGMATAGAGDVLTGMIAGLLGQGLTPLEASVLGSCLHGLAGDIAARESGLHSLIASDIIRCLPAAFSALKTD